MKAILVDVKAMIDLVFELENMNIYDNDVDMMAETFSSKLVEIRNTCVPNKEIKILDKPWFNNKLRKSNRLFKAYKKLNITFTATPANGTTKTRLGSLVTSAHEKYSLAKKDYEKCARQAKTQYLHNLKKTLLNPGVSSKKKFKIFEKHKQN